MATAINAIIADEVRAQMARRRRSQSSVSTETGISERTLARRLSGASSFTIDELVSIADSLGCPVRQLIGPATQLTA